MEGSGFLCCKYVYTYIVTALPVLAVVSKENKTFEQNVDTNANINCNHFFLKGKTQKN